MLASAEPVPVTEPMPSSERKIVGADDDVRTPTTPAETVTVPETPGWPARYALAAVTAAPAASCPASSWVAAALLAARAAPAAADSALAALVAFWPPSMTRPAVKIMAVMTKITSRLTDWPRASRRRVLVTIVPGRCRARMRQYESR